MSVPAAIANAVADALGRDDVELPFTPRARVGAAPAREAGAVRVRAAGVARRGARGCSPSGGDDAKVLAGGQSLVPALNMRLAASERSGRHQPRRRARRRDARTDGRMRVGATVRQADRSTARASRCSQRSLPHVGHTVTRNRGTVCGSIAHADAAAELPLCAGRARGHGGRRRRLEGRREIAADELFVGHVHDRARARRARGRDRLAAADDGRRFAFEELAQRGRRLRALVWRRVSRGGDELRVVVGAVDPRTRRCSRSTGSGPASRRPTQVEPWGSIHASPEYLRHLCACSSTRGRAALRSGRRDRPSRSPSTAAATRGRRAAAPPLGLPAPPPRPDRDARRLRARRLRRVHRAPRRRRRPLVPRLRRPGRRRARSRQSRASPATAS